MTADLGIEKKILATSVVFVLALSGVIALTVRLFGIGLPTCLADVRPFQEATVIEQAPNRYEIHYVARMWKFEPAEVTIRPGSTADIYLSAADVTHGMQIVGTNVNLMAVPGAVNYARVKFDKPGEYLVVCNEYCGIAHHDMAAKIVVTDKVAPVPAIQTPEASAAQALLDTYACTACHSVDGSAGVGASFKGLYGSSRPLTDGTTVTADEAYLRESIEKPAAKIVKEFDPVMPADPIPPAEIAAIIDYLKTLK